MEKGFREPDGASDESTSAHRRRRRHRQRRRERKERVLHTRISETLAEDIRRIADDLRVPASNLVRNVLEEVFDVVESVTGDVGQLFDEVLEEAEAARGRLRSRACREPGGAAWQAARAEVDATERSAAPPPPPVEWHLVEAGRACGPLDLRALARAASEGRLRRDTLVWCAGMPDWRPAGRLSALAGLFEPPPVPDADA